MTETEAQAGTSTAAHGGHNTSAPAANIGVLIIAGDEERNIPHTLANVVGWAGQVFVVDSESRDRTPEIVRDAGATLVTHPWQGFARQRNWGLDSLDWTTEWVLILDADESLSPEAKRALEQIASKPAGQVSEAGFYINRLTWFMNKPLRHCGYFPNWNLRLVKHGSARYEERAVHEHLIVDGTTARIDAKALMLHHDRRGVGVYIDKHVKYAMLEASELFNALQVGEPEGDRAKLSGGANLRRWLKHNVLPWLPCPWLFRFLYMYIVKLGFLDGLTGLRFCLLIATYELFIRLRLIELKSYASEDAKPGGKP